MINLETSWKVWDSEDDDGGFTEIGLDRDGLGLVEVLYRNKEGKIEERMVFPPVIALMVSKAMKLCAENLETEKDGY